MVVRDVPYTAVADDARRLLVVGEPYPEPAEPADDQQSQQSSAALNFESCCLPCAKSSAVSHSLGDSNNIEGKCIEDVEESNEKPPDRRAKKRAYEKEWKARPENRAKITADYKEWSRA